MTYTAKTAGQLKRIAGSMIEKIATEFGLIDAEIDKQKVHSVVLTAAQGTITGEATTGIDLADGNDTTYYAVFVPPHDITVTRMTVLLTEAYVKDTTDAVIALSAPTQGTEGTDICSWTLPGTGAVQDYCHNVEPAGGVDINAGKRIDITVTATDTGGSGTGHAVVVLDYVNR